MHDVLLLGITIVISYLIGAIPFGYLIARARGVDIFKHGSGNIGATNVGRVLGRRFGILVFLLDFAKGALPVMAAIWVSHYFGTTLPKNLLEVSAGLASFLGHLFPIYLRFRGGKGVATGAGVVSILLPWEALGAFILWGLILWLTHFVSLASILAVLALCAFRLALTPQPFGAENLVLTLFCFVAAALVILRHRSNISRLLQGKEHRV